MAYTVGSVSVEVVPDFRNAQNAITAWFKAQPDSLKVPVQPDLDTKATAAVNRQAQQVGENIGATISKGISRTMTRDMTGTLSRQIAKLEADIAKARKTNTDATASLTLAEKRLAEMRARGVKEDSYAYQAQDKRIKDLRARAKETETFEAEGNARLLALREQLAEESTRVVQEQIARDAIIQQRAADAAVATARRTAERIAAEQAKATRKADLEAIRQAERDAKAFERLAVENARKSAKAVQDAIRINEKIQVQVEIDQRKALKEGRETGGIVARAIHHEIRQNAGLIAAVIGGVLAAGAPAAIAGASALFAGIGAVSAAQSERVRSTWVGLWDEIKSGAQADAQVLTSTMERVAGQIGQSFQRMRPLVSTAFEAVGPQITSFVSSLTDAAENALPGLVAAAQNGMPVIQGLGTMLEKIGTGLSDFFTRLSESAPAAGQAFSNLGDSFAVLLPLLAELLARGAELANIVLPVINSALGTVLSVVQKLGGALPVLATAFLAFRSVANINAMLTNFAAKMGLASLAGGTFAGVQGALATGASKAARALPAVGIAAAVIGGAFAAAEQRVNSLADGLNRGGEAARAAYKELGNPSFFDKFIYNLTHWGNTQSVAARQTAEARAQNLEYLKSLTPLELAQRDLGIAQEKLSTALAEHGPASREAAEATQQVAFEAARTRREEEKLEMALRGVTQAMLDQAEQARGLADASFAYENALNDLEDAQEDYNKALAEGNEEDKARALLAVQEAYNAVATSARDVALQAMPVLLDANQKAILADKAQLDALLALKAQYGDLGPILENQIAELSAATSGTNANALASAQLAAALAGVGIAAEAIPNEKGVRVTALTDEARAKLEELGLTVIENTEDESFTIIAETAEAEAAMDQIDTHLADIDKTTAVPTVDADTGPIDTKLENSQGALEEIDRQQPKPIVDADPAPFNSVHTLVMERSRQIHQQHPRPIIDAEDRASAVAAAVQRALNNVQDRTVTLTVRQQYVTASVNAALAFRQAGGAAGGAVEALGRHQRRFAPGGAVIGRGSAVDDLVPAIGPMGPDYRIANGEHILTGRDVALLGGQAGVYAFRDALNSGKLGRSTPQIAQNVRQMVTSGSNRDGSSRTFNGFVNHGTIVTQDVEALQRHADMARREMYARELV